MVVQLQAASFRGDEKILQILLEKGAQVIAQGRRYGNALQAASCVDDEKIVQILLGKRAEVNARRGVRQCTAGGILSW